MRAVVAAAIPILVIVIVAGGLLYWRIASQPPAEPAASTPAASATATPSLVLAPHAIGDPVGARERPQIAQIKPVDLDGDGLMDVVVCDMLRNRVEWIRQSPRGTFTE